MEWLEWLKKEANETSCAAVARKVGISRTTISLIVNDKYPASTDKVEEQIKKVISSIHCSFLNRNLTLDECKAYSGEVPTSSPAALRIWKACQQCELKPKEVAYDSGKNGKRVNGVKKNKSRSNRRKLSNFENGHQDIAGVNRPGAPS